MTTPVLLWLRRDLRMADHPALTAAAQAGPVIPVFIADDTVIPSGAAPRYRLGLALEALSNTLEAAGSRLLLRRGDPTTVLLDLARETGARAIHASRSYDPATRAVDLALKSACDAEGLTLTGHEGFLLYEPWSVATGQGGPYKVFTPYYKAVRSRTQPASLPRPKLSTPRRWPDSEKLADWALDHDMHRGAAVLRPHVAPGEDAAQARLAHFIEHRLADYPQARDRLDLAGTSGLSDYLATGEISPRQVWHAARFAMEDGNPGAGKFLSELIWREFAWHLLWHFPELATENWRREWDNFSWSTDSAAADRWRRGETGVDVVDAAMRELYVTGKMHNRARMVTGSYLTKNLGMDWRLGRAWFEDCLIDHDPANNAMGWQWVAGSGPDAAPYFRIFNPETQAERHDPEGDYRRHWLEGAGADAFARAIPRRWRIARPAAPDVPVKASRKAALDRYRRFKDE